MLRELVKDGILTKEEAREILFNLEEQTDRDIESFKSEIKFLRELVEKLANTQKVVEIVREIQKPYYPHYWWKPYEIWCSSGAYTSNGNGLEMVTGGNSNFSNIKTF